MRANPELPERPGSRVLTSEGVFTDDAWRLDGIDAGGAEDAQVLLPLVAWLAQPQPPALGVWLAPDDDPRLLAPHLDVLPQISVHFPKFADGRGLSIAALLRRAGYRGDLRAFGEILVDQLHALRRVGFSSFALRADVSELDAQAALHRYSDAYQGAYDTPLPSYRRPPRSAATS